jgi:hypothetical protein
VAKAEAALQLMRRGGHKVGVLTWNTLLAVTQSATDAPAAMRALEAMAADGCPPDRITFNTALGACVPTRAGVCCTLV